jgi:hypothetical protein
LDGRNGNNRIDAIGLGACRPDMAIKGFPGHVMALAAARRNGELELQLVEAGTAALCRVGNVAVRDPVANANNHGATVMRTIRICNSQSNHGLHPLRPTPER